MLREIGKRGLIYFDGGTSRAASQARSPARSNVAFAKADAVLDAVPAAAEIDNALARLEATARSRGFADRLRRARCRSRSTACRNGCKTADARGITLVPISAVANRAKSAAASE